MRTAGCPPAPWPQTCLLARTPTPGKSDSRSHGGYTEEVEPQLCSGAKQPSHLPSPHLSSRTGLSLDSPLAMLDGLSPSTDHNTTEVSISPQFCHIRILGFKITGSYICDPPHAIVQLHLRPEQRPGSPVTSLRRRTLAMRIWREARPAHLGPMPPHNLTEIWRAPPGGGEKRGG